MKTFVRRWWIGGGGQERWRSPPGGCPWGECSKRAAKGEYPDDYCYTMSEEEMAKFAEYAFVFAGGVKLRLPPSRNS